MNKINFEVLTPEKKVVSCQCAQVVADGVVGQFTILADHASFVSKLRTCVVKYDCVSKENKEESFVFVAGGTLVVENNQLKIFTSAAEKGTDIDLERAQKAKMRAEQRLSAKEDGTDFDRAQVALERALVRLYLVDRVRGAVKT